MEIKIKFKKPIYKGDEIIYYLIKTKTNKFMLLDVVGNILAENKNNILKYIKENGGK